MGQSKSNPTAITTSGLGRFPLAYAEEVERDRCLSFAVALSRHIKWPLHIACLGETACRFYVENDGTYAFDVRGIYSPVKYGKDVVIPWIRKLIDAKAVATIGSQMKQGYRCTDETELPQYGLEIDEAAVATHAEAISRNTAYLSLIPTRPFPHFPGRYLSQYSWNGCLTFAEALRQLSGLPAAVMQPKSLQHGMGLEGDQFHAAVVHSDGELEDVWGKQPAAKVAERYFMASWSLSSPTYEEYLANARAKNPSFEGDIEEAKALIRLHNPAYAERT